MTKEEYLEKQQKELQKNVCVGTWGYNQISQDKSETLDNWKRSDCWEKYANSKAAKTSRANWVIKGWGHTKVNKK